MVWRVCGNGGLPPEGGQTTMSKTKCDANKVVDKAVDFGRQLFAAVLRSRTGALTELARLLRFQRGTKGFEREYDRLLPLRTALREAFKQCVLTCFPETGLRLGIIDKTRCSSLGCAVTRRRLLPTRKHVSIFSQWQFPIKSASK